MPQRVMAGEAWMENGAIRVNEYSSKQSYTVLIDSRAIQWVVEIIKGVVNGVEELSSPKFWHEGLVTSSLQIVHKNRGVVLKILKLSSSGRQVVLIPEGVNRQSWGKLLKALPDKHEGPSHRGLRADSQAGTLATGA
ncbi:hypothetical protein Syun_014137 [Stephania yunnanensis]|uniref:Uncharacterized protein n=1 Tax=Stephania yunnanensis TaxID=152371 RepID=A0AAP0JL22_9MAGN